MPEVSYRVNTVPSLWAHGFVRASEPSVREVLEAAKFASAAKKKLDELIKAAQEKSEQAIEDEKRVAAVRAFNAGPHPHLSLSRCSGREPTRMLCFAACVLLALASLVILTWGGT